MALFTISKSKEFSGVTVFFDDDTTQTLGSDDPNYDKIVQGLLADTLNDDELLKLIAPFELIYKQLTRLSERVSRKGSALLFDGDVIKNALTDHIIKIMNEGDEDAWRAYVAFMEKLHTNPSDTSREHLFHFIDANGLQVTPEGDIVLYKGTKEDGKSTHAGYGIVDGVEFKNAYLQNALGSVVEIPRSMVDVNRYEECSTGLHVGAFEYVTGKHAGTWPRMWTVLVNPRDVVAVPHDFKSSKIRVVRYKIVGELGHTRDAKKHEGLVWSPEPVIEAKVEAPRKKEPKAEKPEPTVTINTVTQKVVQPTTGSRVEEYKNLIRSGGAGTNLKRYRNKSVTAGRREEFDQAVKELGLQYS